MKDMMDGEERAAPMTVSNGNSKVTLLVNHLGLKTFVLEYPRYIHSELMTHRVFSRNARSSRAIPVEKLIYEAEHDYVKPTRVYENCRGMEGKTLMDPMKTFDFYHEWDFARSMAIQSAKRMAVLGAHKQHINRILEPFTKIKVILTGDDFENFFNIRISSDVEPEMLNLACLMQEAIDDTDCEWRSSQHIFELEEKDEDGEDVWPAKYVSLPFVNADEIDKYDPIDLFKISAARCARVSYNNHDGTAADPERDLKLAEELLKNGHMSPFEHPCVYLPERGTLHYNLKDWASFRYLYENKRLAVLEP